MRALLINPTTKSITEINLASLEQTSQEVQDLLNSFSIAKTVATKTTYVLSDLYSDSDKAFAFPSLAEDEFTGTCLLVGRKNKKITSTDISVERVENKIVWID